MCVCVCVCGVCVCVCVYREYNKQYCKSDYFPIVFILFIKNHLNFSMKYIGVCVCVCVYVYVMHEMIHSLTLEYIHSLGLSLWLGIRIWNPLFSAFLTLHDRQGSCNPCEISWTLWLHNTNHLHLYRPHTFFFFLPQCFLPSLNSNHKSPI